jgi:hypothetical protein
LEITRNGTLTSRSSAHDKTKQEEHEKNDERHVRDGSRHSSNAGEPKNTCNDCDHEKRQSPAQHGMSPLTAAHFKQVNREASERKDYASAGKQT